MGLAGSSLVIGSQLRQDIRRWLSPPDPSTNHNVASSARHKGMAKWFFQGTIFREWKSAGSLLWVHGKRAFLLPFNSTLSDDHLSQLVPARVYSGSLFLNGIDLKMLTSRSALRSSRTSFPYATVVWPLWPTFIATLGTPASKTDVTYLPLSSFNSPLDPILVEIFSPVSTSHMIAVCKNRTKTI